MPEVDDDKNNTPSPEVGNGNNAVTPNGETVNQRLLQESKEYKKKYQDAQAQIDALQKGELEKQGNYKSLLEKEQKEKADLQETLRQTNQRTLKANINSVVARHANDVADFEDLMNQPKFKSILEAGIDGDELTVSDEAAQKYVKAVLEAKPHLKKVTTIPGTHKGGKPGYVANSGEKKSLSQMTKEEIEKDLLESYGKK